MGLVRSEEQIRYQEISYTTSGAIQRALAAGDEGKYAIIKRNTTKRKEGLTSVEVPLEVACVGCRFPRLDVSPYYCSYGTGQDHHVYVAAYGQCPRCLTARDFSPVDGRVGCAPLYQLQEGRSLRWFMDSNVSFAPGVFAEVVPLVGEAGREGVLLRGENFPMMIPGSEVYVRLPKDDCLVDSSPVSSSDQSG